MSPARRLAMNTRFALIEQAKAGLAARYKVQPEEGSEVSEEVVRCEEWS